MVDEQTSLPDTFKDASDWLRKPNEGKCANCMVKKKEVESGANRSWCDVCVGSGA